MKAAGKSWSLYVFSSVNAIRKYTMEELVQLGVSWIWLGLESPKSTYAKLHELRYPGAGRRVAAARHQAAGLDHRRPGAPHAGEHRAGNRVRGLARHRLSPVHALHAGAGNAAVRSRCRKRAACSRASTWPTSTGSSSSTSSTPPSRAKSRSASSTGPSASTSSAMDRACFGFAKPFFRAGSAITTIPTLRVRQRMANEAVKLRTTYDAALWVMEKRLQEDQRRGFSPDSRTAPRNGARVRHRDPTCCVPSSGRSCCGPRSAKTADWRAARPTSRKPSSTAGIGWKHKSLALLNTFINRHKMMVCP